MRFVLFIGLTLEPFRLASSKYPFQLTSAFFFGTWLPSSVHFLSLGNLDKYKLNLGYLIPFSSVFHMYVIACHQ